MPEHASGPLEVDRTGSGLKTIHGSPGMDLSELVPVYCLSPGISREWNARRIVAAWNACEAIKLEDLESVASLKNPLVRLQRLAGLALAAATAFPKERTDA